MAVSALINETRRRRTAQAYRQLIGDRRIVCSFITVTELRFGALKAGWGDLRRRALERDLARIVIVQPDDRLMHICAELRATCALAGHPLGQKIHEADRWIAATALRLGVPLVSADSVYQHVADLHVLAPST
jgi:predicted nucleic acid-binding protein